MDIKRGLLGIVALAMVLAACSAPAAKPDTMMKESPTPDAMMKKDASTSDAMMAKATPTADAMMAKATATPDALMKEGQAALTLSFTGLENLGAAWVYEGWLIVDGQPISSGVFTVDDKGAPSATKFIVAADKLSKATAFVLTIEPSPDPDPSPSKAHVLGGDFSKDTAELFAGHPAALGNGLQKATGSYILGIPTSDSSKDSYTNGIWLTALDLPKLPAGWVYEGWVVGSNGPVSTGRFASAKSADSDGAGPTAGPKASPAFPGQDFLKPPVNLTKGYAAVISVEPEPDNSQAPFVFKPLVDKSIEDVGDHVPQSMENNVKAFPTGKAMRDITISAAMMAKETPTAGAMTAKATATPDAMMKDAMAAPAWFNAKLTDVNTGKSFKLADLKGKVVLVETMAVWCSNCLKQQNEVKALHTLLGKRDDFVSVALDIDPNENDGTLKAHAMNRGFDWTYAVTSAEVAREIAKLYGDQFLNPPSTPMLIIDRQGKAHPLPFGIKSSNNLKAALEPYLQG